MTLDSQALEKCCLASWISVKDENCTTGEIFQDPHLLDADLSSQKADRAFEARLMQSQNIEVPFDHENGVVRDSELLQAEQDSSLVEHGRVGRVYVLRLKRAVDGAPAESYNGASLVRER